MKSTFSIDDLALLTGLSTRTIRTYISDGFIDGDKSTGSWQFTPEQVDAFLQNKTVAPAIDSKRNAIVFDFLGSKPSGKDKMCIVLDISSERKLNASRLFCRYLSEYDKPELELRFASEPMGDGLRVILSGSDADVTDILKRYYQES